MRAPDPGKAGDSVHQARRRIQGKTYLPKGVSLKLRVVSSTKTNDDVIRNSTQT